MLEGADRIKRIVDDLKEYAKDKPMTAYEEMDVNAVVAAAITLSRNKLKHATSDFRIEKKEGLPRIRGNFQKIEQVVINLLMNACEAMVDNAKAVVVRTDWDQTAGQLLVQVQDEGTGMTGETLRQIKDPFFTTKRDQGGTGLGVSISARIIEVHGGTLEYESVIGVGTTATIRLPVGRCGGEA